MTPLIGGLGENHLRRGAVTQSEEVKDDIRCLISHVLLIFFFYKSIAVITTEPTRPNKTKLM